MASNRFTSQFFCPAVGDDVMTTSRYKIAFLPFLLLNLNLGFMASAGQSAEEPTKPEEVTWDGDFTRGWRQFEQLTKEQKHQAATFLVEKMLTAARAKNNNDEWTRCLIRLTRRWIPRMPWHNWEIPVRFLQGQPWPDDLMGSSVLNLYYAQILANYARADSRAISSSSQMYEEVQKSFNNVWRNRSQLGELPNSQWREYLSLNNYPPGLRPTLRDTASYMWVETLADTNGRQLDRLSAISRLNLKTLADGHVGETSLIDPARHPLEKICYILADLENWHSQRGEWEAAMEARLERYRNLYQHFIEAEARKFIQNDLENYLKPLARVPWWAEGMAQLAEFIKSENQSSSGKPAYVPWWVNDSDSLVRARQIAFRGEAVYPRSIGGKHCHAILENIEGPDYSISGMLNDNLHKKSILAIHRNLEKLYFRAYPIDLIRTIETLPGASRNLLPFGSELEENLIAKKTPAYQWNVALPATPDYQMHKTFIVLPIAKPGAYLIVASAHEGFPKQDNKLQALYMVISDLTIIPRREEDNVEVRVLSGSSGKPVVGAEVMLYSRYSEKLLPPKKFKLTDSLGIAQFTIDEGENEYFLVARHGAQIAYDPREPDFDNASIKQDHASHGALIFTDGSAYRPLQKIFWKVVLYENSLDDIHFETSPAESVTISLKDAKQQVVESKTVTTNSFGTASGEFVIPSDRAPGLWRLTSSQGGGVSVSIGGEEYKRLNFEVKILDPEKPLRINEKTYLRGEVKYSSGAPVSIGLVHWSLRRVTWLPPWWGWRDSSYNSSLSQVKARGTESLKDDGTFSFSFLPEIDERFGRNKDVTYGYAVLVDVTDKEGETRSAQQWFSVGFVSVQARASLDKAFFLVDEPKNISVSRRNLDGGAIAGKGTWRIAALKTPSKIFLPVEQSLSVPDEFKASNIFLTPGDLEQERWRPSYSYINDHSDSYSLASSASGSYSYQFENFLLQCEEGAIQASGSISHDDKGDGEISVGHLAPGAYRLIYETVDDSGAKYEMQRHFIVAAPSMQLPLPALLLFDDKSIMAGRNLRVLAHSGFKDQFMILEVFRGEKRILRKEMISGKDSSLIEIPITEEDRGGLGITLSLVRDNQFIQLKSKIEVPWDNKKLKVEFTTFHDRLRPGSEGIWVAKVTGPTGEDVAIPGAELLAFMDDRGQDSISSYMHDTPDDLYPQLFWFDRTQANLLESERLDLDSKGFDYERLPPILTKDRFVDIDAIPPNGIRPGQIRSIPSNSLPVGLNRKFSETAFWQPHLLTGADGSATIKFKVPDSAASWSVWVLAITHDLKWGFVHCKAQSK
jgi:alpha-2-macroglobulin